MIRLNINGKQVDVDASPDTPLFVGAARLAEHDRNEVWLWHVAVRRLYGAGQRRADALGARRRSGGGGQKITTIEDVEKTRSARRCRPLWRKHDVVQCGFCQSGADRGGDRAADDE